MADAPPAATQYSDSEEERFTRYFDPNQNADERRDIKRESRALDREFRGERSMRRAVVWAELIRTHRDQKRP